MTQANTLAATITKATGPVSVLRHGKAVTLHQGDDIYASDTISTNTSTVEITFKDGTISVLSAQAVMKVAEFSTADDDPSFVLNLTQGAMRAISGQVVAQNPDAFKVTTPKATVGIRGTDYIVKINPDSSETVVVLSLDQGHNVVVTTYSGEQISVTTIYSGAFIPAGPDGTINPQSFTPQEIDSIVHEIMAALQPNNTNDKQELDDEVDDDTEGNVEASTDGMTIELSMQLVSGIGEENAALIGEALENALLDAASGADTENAFGLSDNDITLLIERGDDEDRDAPSTSEEEKGDDVIDDGFIKIDFDGNTTAFADHDINNIVPHRVTITNAMTTPGVVLSGDIMDASITNTSITAAGDIINGGTMSNGRIVGDAQELTLSNGTFTSGDDTISLDLKNGGNSVYGDAYTISGTTGNISFGNDSITISGEFSNSVLVGDADTIDAALIIDKFGNDYISVGTLGTGGNIYGDTMEDIIPNLIVGGNDTISVGTMKAGSSINTGIGNDLLNITSVEGGTINTEDGNDTLALGTITGSNISTGNGADNIEITTMTGGSINGGSGNDIFEIADYSGGSIDGGSDSDTLTFTDQSANINMGGITNIEQIIIANRTGGTINNTSEALNVKVGTQDAAGTLNGGGMSGNARIEGVDANDTIAVYNMSNNATIESGAGTDTITIHNMGGDSSIDTGIDNDSVTITGNMSGGSLYGAGGHDTFNIANINGTVNISCATDAQSSATVIGTVNTGGHLTLERATSSDSAEFNLSAFNIQGGTLVLQNEDSAVHTVKSIGNGGTFTFDNVITTSVTITDGINSAANFSNTGTVMNSNEVKFMGEISDGANITFTTPNGKQGFNITGNTANGFVMHAGTVHGSDGDDFIEAHMWGGTITDGAGADTIEITSESSGSSNPRPTISLTDDNETDSLILYHGENGYYQVEIQNFNGNYDTFKWGGTTYSAGSTVNLEGGGSKLVSQITAGDAIAFDTGALGITVYFT